MIRILLNQTNINILYKYIADGRAYSVKEALSIYFNENK